MYKYKIILFKDPEDAIPEAMEYVAKTPFSVKEYIYSLFPNAEICSIRKIDEAPLTQSVEVMDLKSIQSRFESEREYQ